MNGKVYRGRGAAILVVSLALYLVGLSSYLISSGWQTLGDMAGEINVSAVVRDSVKSNPVTTIKELEKIAGVQKVEYIDSRKAEKELSELLESNVAELLGSDALPSIYLMTLKVADATPQELVRLKNQVESLEWVDEVYYEEAFGVEIEKKSELLGEVLRFIGYIVGAVALLLSLLAIKLSVGATLNCYNQRSFPKVRSEAMRWALISGVISGVISAALLFFTVKASHLALPATFSLSYEQIPIISAMLVIASTVVSVLATLIWLEVHKK